jgi:hypothetical protein
MNENATAQMAQHMTPRNTLDMCAFLWTVLFDLMQWQCVYR